MVKRLVVSAFVLAAALPQTALAVSPHQGCELQLIATPSQWRSDDIDVFATDPTTSAFDVQLENTGDTACNVHLDFDTIGAPFGLSGNGSSRVPYLIVEHGSGKDLTPRNGHSTVNFPGVIKIDPNSSQIVRFDVVFPSTFDADGTFSQVLQIQAKSGPDVMAQRSVTLTAVAPSSATMALSGNFTRTGTIADVDLGNLDDAGSIKVPLILHVRSTRGYQIRSSSENGGKLELAGTQWAIPYKLTIDGETVDSEGGTYSSTLGEHKRQDNLKLGFALTGSTDVAAGRYSDTLTLEVSVN